jgi:hypothetical protein
MKRVICQMKTYPDCPGQTLTSAEAEADEFRLKPKQLRLL